MTSNNSTITASISVLLEIVANETQALRSRIDACETLLAYETPAQVTEHVKGFLTSIIADRERIHTHTRLRASTLLRKYESRKIAQRTIGSTSSDHWNEVWRGIRAGRRRLKLDRLGLWPPPPDPNWYADILADDEPLRPSEYPR
jgi:hypothetical protein